LVRTSSAHRDLVYVTIVTAGAFLAVTATDLRETLVNWATAHPLNVAMNAVVAANQAMTRFLAAMSHELHTPLIVPGSFLIHLSPWLGNP
jgi:signal transduction histidine kinase